MVSATLALLDPNELPRYTVPEAAHYLRMPHETLKSWVVGRNYPVSGGEKHWAGLIKRPDDADPKLSFSNLIEAHVLLALRKQYGVKMKEIRESLEIAQERFNIPRVLLSPQLRATKGNVFLDQLHQLTNLSKGGQGAIPEILEAYLDRMDPLTRPDLLESPKLLAIDPRIAFGRPVVKRNAIKTSAIAERFRAGESISELADDYDLEVFEVEEALRYELPDAA